MAGLLGRRLGRPVVAGYLCANAPSPAEAVRSLRAAGHRRVAVARHLMAPGHFARRAQEAGAASSRRRSVRTPTWRAWC